MTDHEKLERRRAAERARQERLRRRAGMPTRAEWLALSAAKRARLEQLAEAHGVSTRTMRRWLKAGKVASAGGVE